MSPLWTKFEASCCPLRRLNIILTVISRSTVRQKVALRTQDLNSLTINSTTAFGKPPRNIVGLYKMQLKLNLIAAACENMGIGVNGALPWKLKTEMAFFTKMTTETKDKNKKNVVLMGRRTWECIPKKYRPLENRINMVLSTKPMDYGNEAIGCKSLSNAIETILQLTLNDEVESIWVIGGTSVYKAAMESPNFHRLYLTKIKKQYDCDTFFPPIPNDFVLTQDPSIPQGIQEENGIQFEYNVYKKQ